MLKIALWEILSCNKICIVKEKKYGKQNAALFKREDFDAHRLPAPSTAGIHGKNKTSKTSCEWSTLDLIALGPSVICSRSYTESFLRGKFKKTIDLKLNNV